MNTVRDLAQRFAIEGWGTNPGWEKVWDELCHPAMVLRFCGTPEIIAGLSANKRHNRELFAGFPTIKQEILGLLAEGNQAAYRHILTGLHTGPFLGIPPTGKSPRMSGMTWLRFENGRIVEYIYELNHAELARQLGLAA